MAERNSKKNAPPTSINDLPEDLIHDILGRLSLRDVVRTSFWSLQWRFYWIRCRDIVFDRHLVEDICNNWHRYPDRTARYINSVGPFLRRRRDLGLTENGYVAHIQKFVLSVPLFPLGDPQIIEKVEEWMEIVSHCRVKYLTIISWPHYGMELPAGVFSCPEVQFLQLDYCWVRTPLDFQGFQNLTALVMTFPRISAEALETLVSGCPQLDTLSVTTMIGGDVVLSAPRLRALSLLDCYISVIEFRNTPNLTTVSLSNYSRERRKLSHMIEFFASIPQIENITFEIPVLEAQLDQGRPARLPATLQRLTNLTLTKMDKLSPDYLSLAFCVIRSSPNLRTLNLSMRLREGADETRAVKSLEALSEDLRDTNFSLRTVKIKGLMGGQTERELIKVILSRCPALESVHLNADPKYISDADQQDMITEVRQVQQHTSGGFQVVFPNVPDDDFTF